MLHSVARLMLAGIGILTVSPLRGAEAGIDAFFKSFTDEWVRGSPNLATSTRYFSGDEQDRLEQQLSPVGEAYQHARTEVARKGLAELKKFDRAKMTAIQRQSAELLEWQLDAIVDAEPFRDYSFPFEQFGGVNVNLPNTLTVNHPMLTEKDAVHYIARLGHVSARMEEALADARRIAARGFLPPRFIIRATLTQMNQFIATPAAQNPFVSVYGEKLRTIKALSDARRSDLQAQAARIVEQQVYPAWRRAIAFLQPLETRVNDDPGLWRFKNGAEIYANALRRFTTTNMTAEQIHQTGLRKVAEIEQEMDKLLRQLGRTQGPVKDRVERLKKDQAYPLTEDGRKRIMADVEQILRDAQKRSKTLFDRTPKSPVVAQPYARFREANAAASYNSPSPDGSRPGTFQIPLRPERMTKFGLRSLVYHETVPGHHFQIALEMENPALPRFRQIRAFGGISALSEGWGLYAEHLAAESGWYEGDVEGRIGQLDSELFRARRLVVDTGLHAKHWTRQQAIDYGIEASEIERYVVNPGQACSYMIGELKQIELRERAKKALGRKFSFFEYHNTVLSAGTLPLELLERQVDEYIRAASK